jgi:serine phosphatase RsbU (regulator of sigma subunit)
MPNLPSLSGLNRPSQQFFRTLPPRAKFLLYAGIFCCFAPMGLLQESMSLRVEPIWVVAFNTVYSGAAACLFAWVMLRHPRWFPVPLVLLFALPFVMRLFIPQIATPTELDAAGLKTLATRLQILSMLSIACMAGAYVSFFALVQREGLRYSSAHAEIRLAREIHATLVPDLAGQRAHLSWRGRSRPSGDVGGDLVDVVDHPRGWCATVADVTGHGVAAGVLMGMFKTAFRASLDDARDVADLATRVNRIISPLRQPNMFVTTACLRQIAPGQFEYVLAGHPPMLHIASGGTSSTWIGSSQLALGLLDNTAYTSGTISLNTGDMLVMLTDGLIEVFDRADRELGLDGVRNAATAASRSGSLADVEQAIFAACASHGIQLDDQTILLLKQA